MPGEEKSDDNEDGLPTFGKHTQHRRSRKSSGKMMKIKLEKMGRLPDLKGRVFTIERDERFHNVHVYHQEEKIKLKMFRMKWHDLKPNEKFLEKFDKMWTYRERPRGYIEKLGQFFIGDIKEAHKEYFIDFFPYLGDSALLTGTRRRFANHKHKKRLKMLQDDALLEQHRNQSRLGRHLSYFAPGGRRRRTRR